MCLMFYSALITFGFTKFGFWKWSFIKDIVIWTMLVGVPTCFSAVNNAEKEERFFRDFVIDNFKLTALIEFFTGAFTFNIIAEILLQPVLLFLTIIEYFSEKDEKNKILQILCQIILLVIGLYTIAFSFKIAVDTFNIENSIELLISFFIPIAFSIVFVPVAYCLTLYAKYEALFIRISIKEPKNNKLKYRFKIICACNIRLSNVVLFQKNYVYRIYQTISDTEYLKIINDFVIDVKSDRKHKKDYHI